MLTLIRRVCAPFWVKLMLARKIGPLLLCLLPLLAACAPKGPVPWQIEPAEDLQVQVKGKDGAVANIRIGIAAFSGTEAAVQVSNQLALLWQQKLEERAVYAEQLLIDAEFNGNLPAEGIFFTQEENPAVFYNDGRKLSLVIDGYMNEQNAAHPLVYRYAYNFNALTGKQLALADLWGEDAFTQVAEEIFAQIEKEGRLDDFYPGLAENLYYTLTEYNWYMDKENIYVFYNPYDIGPYALGIVEFVLPL